jgi:hypothetical protein
LADEFGNLVLEHLHANQADGSDVKVRMTSMEENMAAMNRRLDNMDRRIEGIEKRLELVETYASKSTWNQFPGLGKYPPAEPGALALEPLEAADGGANAAPKFWAT